jgi:hypothetical protein
MNSLKLLLALKNASSSFRLFMCGLSQTLRRDADRIPRA